MNSRARAKSVSSALATLSMPPSLRRTHSATIEVAPRSIRIVVLGVGGVGKTAMIVRFVTKRFIGDYDPTLETIYRHSTVVDDQLVNFELMDTAGQGEKTLLLEDKCKWGESFVFVYDVTDRYSFDELTRLKFIASYTHSRLRVNFTPCWVLVGNKADLADRERMVSTEEGQELAKGLGCHIFREISVKESNVESGHVFADLWREFSRMSPRSPSSSQRRKFSIRIQDKISTLDSHSCSCRSESIKHNGSVVSSITNTLRRHSSNPALSVAQSRLHKEQFVNDANNNESRVEPSRNCPCILEHIEENEEVKESDDAQQQAFARARTRRLALHPEQQQADNKALLSRRKALCKSVSADNVFHNVTPISPTGTGTPLTSSSRSSSSSSLNGSSSPTNPALHLKMKLFDRMRVMDSSPKQQLLAEDQKILNGYRGRSRRGGTTSFPGLALPVEISQPSLEYREVDGR